MRMVAAKLGFSYQQEAKIEHGQNACSAYRIVEYAALFGVSIGTLYGEAGLPDIAPEPQPSPRVRGGNAVGKGLRNICAALELPRGEMSAEKNPAVRS
jgi:hypothetical protein